MFDLKFCLQLFMVTLSSGLLVAVVRAYAVKQNIVDEPGERRLHQQKTPRGGGLAIIIIVLLMAGYWVNNDLLQMSVLVGVSLATLTGLLDDFKPLGVIPKLLGMFMAVAAIVWLSSLSSLLGYFVSILAIVALVWWLNLFNFMDGSNGLAASQAVLSLLALSYISLQINGAGILDEKFILLSAAAVIGFIPWNAPKARIFLGDSGSLGIATLIAAISVSLWIELPELWPILLANVWVFSIDATATLIWRMIQRKTWYSAHTEHAYQRLVHLGWSHGQVCLTYIFLDILLVWPVMYLALHYPSMTWLSLSTLTILLLILWTLVQFLYHRNKDH